MKILVFADSSWSVGRVNHDVATHIPEFEFTFVDWRAFQWDYFTKTFDECDVCLTNIVSIRFLRESGIPFNFKKCLFMSHGYIDNKATRIEDITDEWVYGITSDTIRHLFPENVKVFVMPNGVEPSHFHHISRGGELNTIGWCGSQCVVSKQPEWAREISEKTCVELVFASNLSFEDVCKWYNTIDLLLVTSITSKDSETGPLPAFEAIVSGVPVVGTPIGNFKNVPGPKFTTIEEGIQVVSELKSNPEMMKQLAKDQYDYVMSNYTYKSFVHKWKEALEYVYLRSKISNN